MTKSKKEKLKIQYNKKKKILEKKFSKELEMLNSLYEQKCHELNKALKNEYQIPIKILENKKKAFCIAKDSLDNLQLKLMGNTYPFTKSEYEIINLYKSGLSTKEIAEELGCSINTLNDKKNKYYK